MSQGDLFPVTKPDAPAERVPVPLDPRGPGTDQVPGTDPPPIPAGLIATYPGRDPGVVVSVGRDPDTGLWWFRPFVVDVSPQAPGLRFYGPWGGYHFDVTDYATKQWGEIPRIDRG